MYKSNSKTPSQQEWLTMGCSWHNPLTRGHDAPKSHPHTEREREEGLAYGASWLYTPHSHARRTYETRFSFLSSSSVFFRTSILTFYYSHSGTIPSTCFLYSLSLPLSLNISTLTVLSLSPKNKALFRCSGLRFTIWVSSSRIQRL